ncbi:MAG: hypothetical protein Q9217_004899 [Psora testacea]
MSSHPEVIRLYTGIEIDPELIEEAQRECDGLDLNTTESFKVFQPDKKAAQILDSVKKRVCFRRDRKLFKRDLKPRLTQSQNKRDVLGRSVHVTLPGVNTKYLRTPCIAIPIKTQSLSKIMITRSGQNVSVSWKAGKVWEILQDVKFQDIKAV